MHTVAIIVAALAGALGGYIAARRTARATETAAGTSKPHEVATAEIEAFKAFMSDARVERAELMARLASCEQKHSDAERARLQTEIDHRREIAALQARIQHLEERVAGAGKSLGGGGAGD